VAGRQDSNLETLFYRCDSVHVLLSRFFAWKEALVIVKPETLIRWHRKGFDYFGVGRAKGEVGRGRQLNFSSLSRKWLNATQRAVKSASPLSFC